MNSQLNIKSLLYTVCLLLILPNFVFYLVTLWTGDHRSIFNIDYLVPLLCFISHNRIIKSAGAILFILVFAIDTLLIVLQHYPGFHFRDSFYLISFIFSGPKIFLVYALAVITILAIEIAILWKFAKKTTIHNTLAVVLLLIIGHIACYFIDDSAGAEPTPYQTSLMASNTSYFIDNQQTSFASLLGGDLLEPSPYYHATTPWTNAIQQQTPLNQKLFLIVVESWGEPLNQAMQEDVLKNLKAKADLFEYFEQGDFLFRGFTVEGELRELCQLYPSTVDLYKIKTGFQHCMPHDLNKLGYETQAIHGGSSTIYGRKEWYPKAGFNIRTFQEELNQPVNCIPFDGICDWDILPYLKQSFAQDKKLFNYWLTLTSHYTYYKHDIHNERFNCRTYNLPANGDACRSFMLQAQFFDYIADFISSPEMQGVEVVIVGDHPPPLFKAEEIALFKTKEMQDGKVGWVHFKIKEPNSPLKDR